MSTDTGGATHVTCTLTCLQLKTHPEMLVAGWIVALRKTVLHLELACSYKCTAGHKTIVEASIKDGVRRKKVGGEPPPPLGTTRTMMCTRLRCLRNRKRVTVRVSISVLSSKQD